MGMREARAQIVTIVEDLFYYDSTQDRWEARRVGGPYYGFKHYPDASDQKLPKPRGFWIRSLSHAMKGPFTPALPTRMVSEMQLSVAYRNSSDPSVDDENMAFDHRQISAALLDASKWSRSTSTIISIHAEGEELCPGVVDYVDGAKILRITFPMEYTV
jgi:hypothetical protein